MKPCVIPLAVIALIASVSAAEGHIAPAKGRNNQYIKVTPMGDRVRLSYTIYVGDEPGRRARRRMDKNRDGLLDESETKPYGDATATAVAGGLRATIDGEAVPITWDIVNVGLGVPQTNARWFSVDLVAWMCIPVPGRHEHRLRLGNSFRIPKPGETEIRVEESPGVAIERSTIADGRANQLSFRWRGGATPLATEPYELTFRVDPDVATVAADEVCPAGGRKALKSAPPGRVLVAIAGGSLLAIAAAWLLLRKRNRRTP